MLSLAPFLEILIRVCFDLIGSSFFCQTSFQAVKHERIFVKSYVWLSINIWASWAFSSYQMTWKFPFNLCSSSTYEVIRFSPMDSLSLKLVSTWHYIDTHFHVLDCSAQAWTPNKSLKLKSGNVKNPHLDVKAPHPKEFLDSSSLMFIKCFIHDSNLKYFYIRACI